MKKPPALKQGDRVHVVFPASPVKPEFFEPGIRKLEELGFVVTYPPDPLRKWRYLAGPDERRASELIEALLDPTIAAIFFARGGYGTSRLIPYLEKITEPLPPKVLIGCSDITSIHLYFAKKYGWIVFHGPMPAGDFARRQLHFESLRDAVMQSGPYVLSPEGIECLISGEAEGVLAGGCLTLLDAAAGTPWMPDLDDKIVFLEDVASKPYQIDRMLTHLKLAGKLQGARAFIFGEMKDCVQVDGQGYTLQEVIIDVLGNLGKPIYYNFPSGHVSGLNWTLPFGVQAQLKSTPFALRFTEGAVS